MHDNITMNINMTTNKKNSNPKVYRQVRQCRPLVVGSLKRLSPSSTIVMKGHRQMCLPIKQIRLLSQFGFSPFDAEPSRLAATILTLKLP